MAIVVGSYIPIANKVKAEIETDTSYILFTSSLLSYMTGYLLPPGEQYK